MAKKVMVGMSGGVDSSVAALLLKEQGYDVYGVTLSLWDDGKADFANEKSCCSLSATDDARAVAEKIGIPYYVLNFKDVFKKYVIDDFVAAYSRGETPNPCIRCNQFVKYQCMLDKALAMGMDFIATGHYAKIEQENGRYVLKTSKGGKKDQTYFLYQLTQHQLAHTLFPISHLTKDEVRSIAQKAGLPVAHKSESQEICFIPDNNYARFLKENGVLEKPGDVVMDGSVIARHQGIFHYTVGQRRGLGIAWEHPLYVTGIDADKNVVEVGKNEDLFGDSLVARDLNCISQEAILEPTEVTAKIRYGAAPAKALVTPLGCGRVFVKFDEAQRAITAGQAVVFYKGDAVLGGATIEKQK